MRNGGSRLEGVFVIKAHSSAGSEIPCGRPGRQAMCLAYISSQDQCSLRNLP